MNRSKLAPIAMVLAGYLLLCVPGRAAAEITDGSESATPAFAASAVFDLRPRVPRASFKLRRPELQALYDAIAKAYGVQLIYDSEFRPSRPVSDFHLEDVTLQQALDAAGNITSTFVAPLDENTGIVANDTPVKRGEYERQVLSTFSVGDQTTPQEITEITTALRTMLDLRRVAQDTRSNWITVLGRARQVAAAREFMDTMQKERGEVMVDVDILELDSQRARELGVLPPQPFDLLYIGRSALLPSVAVLTFGGGRTLYGIHLPGAAAALTFSSSAVRSRQQLHLRAQDGREASLLIGNRFPVITGIVSSSFFVDQTSQTAATANLGFFPAIQYEDIGVKFKATPFLHSGKQLTLKMDLALRGVGSQTFNTAPIISNRQITAQFRMSDGETYVVGGIMNRSRTESVSGYPVLSRLPVIGRLFGAHRKQQAETEMLVMIRPHVVRVSAAEEYASNFIYFGKELQGLPAAPMIAPPVPVAPPQPAPPPQLGVPPGVPQPGVAPPGTAPVPQVPPLPPGMIPGVPVPPSQQPLLPPGIMPGVQPQQPQQPQTLPPGMLPGVQQPAPQQEEQQR